MAPTSSKASIRGILSHASRSRNVTAEDDKNYIINNMLLPILDHEEHDVIILTHSYSSVPGSAAVAGLSKAERAKEGKKTGVLGQIMLAALLAKGGDGKSVKDAFGGQFPPHIRPDVRHRPVSVVPHTCLSFARAS
ncbi:hypothetical protein SLS60_011134 [Paraconiothyrium brasiliense]|uniref:Uncharacterized protein n=1 Tax=Paraconiothyrium brasiliense TaxID=300254 RepID=A0ABR3QKN8_9PLEO